MSNATVKRIYNHTRQGTLSCQNSTYLKPAKNCQNCSQQEILPCLLMVLTYSHSYKISNLKTIMYFSTEHQCRFTHDTRHYRPFHTHFPCEPGSDSSSLSSLLHLFQNRIFGDKWHRFFTGLMSFLSSVVTVSKCFLSVGFCRFCRKNLGFWFGLGFHD